MSNNRNLNRAKQVKNDEFYTQYSDIEAELSHYWKELKGKWVYCWCDNPEQSQFWAYFRDNFRSMGLKRLTSTYYVPKGHPVRTDLFPNGRKTVKPLEGNGDFRSAECQDILMQCDVVVTNPPFSLIREMIPNILDAGKKMVILGPVTAAGTNGICENITSERLWLGYEHGRNMAFDVPKNFSRPDVYCGEDGKKKCDIGNIVWFTNLGRPIRHEGLPAESEYKPKVHRYADGTELVNVDALADSPKDYYGPVAAPITAVPRLDRKEYEMLPSNGVRLSVDGEEKFKRIVIRKIPNALKKPKRKTSASTGPSKSKPVKTAKKSKTKTVVKRK